MKSGVENKKGGRAGAMAGMLLASVAGSVLAFPSIGLAQAEASQAVHSFNIPAQPLDAALMDFGQQDPAKRRGRHQQRRERQNGVAQCAYATAR